ncbi:hypothetical protein [Hydrogenophaga pseudoflava]|uniref:hypothetical protein n=1 Tax=Hydrogenophaga pseudoflava TaxID=47421 RepID=UPI0027E56EEB|nr:hypothetical protein [Hydrogenophaga pseudoflava]MDQ7746221.1 hypothetical protein [Hydrogenophaga pseudoflava]
MSAPEPDNGPDTTPGIPPSRPASLAPYRVADTAFRPPERDGMNGLSIGLFAAVVVLGLYALVNWPWSRPAAVAGVPAAEAVKAAPAQTPAPAPAGMRGQPVDTTTAVSVEGAQGTTLYRCRGAGRFWSVVHCQHRGAEVVAMHTVPANLSLAEQIVFARNREALARPAKGATPRAADGGPVASLNATQQKASDCRRLDELVAVLDDYARQPLPPREQDSVRRDRKKLRDEQFRLHCGR